MQAEIYCYLSEIGYINHNTVCYSKICIEQKWFWCFKYQTMQTNRIVL